MNKQLFQDEWKLYRDDGTVKVTRTAQECEAAARPDVDEEYNNYCVQCLPEYVDKEAAIQTFVIPVTPVSQTTPREINRMGAVGVALNGIKILIHLQRIYRMTI